jgi:hypothetical protein
MKKKYLTILFLIFFLFSFSQSGFEFNSKKRRITIPFKIINNLIIIPVEVNGVKLNFLLDTGVEKTTLFSIEEADSLKFAKVEKIMITGLGTGNSISALRSKENIVKINDYVDKKHEIFIVLDKDINFSSQLGITIHGIIGYDFFINYLIEINYSRKKVFVYKNKKQFNKSKYKRYNEIPISIEFNKPFINAEVTLNNNLLTAKLLIDTGGSDGLWLFENGKNIKSPPKYFDDFLGKGFSGSIYGKRSRVEKIKIGDNSIQLPTVSFPDSLSMKNVSLTSGRNGSIGSEILRRFNMFFDYSQSKMYLKKNHDFTDPFEYNMSGIEIEHNGLELVKEVAPLYTRFAETGVSYSTKDDPSEVKYQFVLKPVYEIVSVRKNSPAEAAGLMKSDIIKKINGIHAYKFKLQQIVRLMQSEDGRQISLEIDRNGIVMKFKFLLKKVL